MELFFLFLLIFLMAFALASGYPLAFALPGSAIISIFLAGLAGYLIEGNPNEYFISDGPFQWLNAGITNFRGVYWEVERDTLIAIPLFIFMGIMLEKSKIAEDLLISMGQLFGPIPGGLGISVIFVGALLAATTGIVGATVVAMGLISLPAMMKNNYNKSLASGIVCSSGTLGQIIPPSIVLIILSDQLASASDAADNMRIENYKNVTGSTNIPSQFSVDSVSAGNMFLGAFLPGLLVGVVWSFWRTFKINNVLKNVMIETSLTTSMVFIILIGAAMLTAAFRGFGGEEIVKDFLTSLPGGFWTQFIVVMAVIFVLGFFLDFIEIAIVVVPIVAPILLAETSANVTAVWLGVMIGVNMQTSFLTPPFGFSLFYLRGVAPKSIKTTEIWKGASVFIVLQLVGLGVVGYFPQLVNYLPLRSYYSSEVSPPPINPKLQECLIDYSYNKYEENFSESILITNDIMTTNIDFLPDKQNKNFTNMINNINDSKNLIEEVKLSRKNFNDYSINYKPLHTKVRNIEKNIYKKLSKIEKIKKEIRLETELNEIQKFEEEIFELENEIESIKMTIPSNWKEENDNFKTILDNFKKKKLSYNKSVDNSFNDLQKFIKIFQNAKEFSKLEINFNELLNNVNEERDGIEEIIKNFERLFNSFTDTSNITKPIKKARKLLKKNYNKKTEALALINEAKKIYNFEKNWRLGGNKIILSDLIKLSETGTETFGLRKQDKLNKEQAIYLASCKSVHEDISLYF